MDNGGRFIIPVSPLRYPGGKRKLAHIVHELATAEGEPLSLAVEPFAGGAAVSISILENTSASVILNDADHLITSFWKVVFSKQASELAAWVRATNPTVGLWHSLRNSSPATDLHRAYKCLVLNRTSFSGILNDRAGPIGGYGQQSIYPISCRFNAEALADRILALAKHQDRVHVLDAEDWRQTVSRVRKLRRTRSQRRGIIWYLDPPFFEKADALYQLSFTEKDHRRLRGELDKLPGRFVLSYDDVPAARAMYAAHPGFLRINLSYNARIDRAERLTAGELIVSDVIARLRARAVLEPMGKILEFNRRRPGAVVQMPAGLSDDAEEGLACQSTS
jgi:DNA adenine methylase